MTALALAVVGASGRMGRAVVRLAIEAGDSVVCAIATGSGGRDVGELAGIRPVGTLVTGDVGAIASSGASVVIDFSSPGALAAVAGAAVAANAALVSGTTGLDGMAARALAEASQSIAVLWEPNMSVGVAILADLVSSAVERLGTSYDIEVVEAHHRLKVDAPSGTALRLVEAAEAARDAQGSRANRANGRSGRPGPRPTSEIGVHAIRGGDVIGDHTVHLLGNGERIELTHRATSRDLFAHGALRAAHWIAGRSAGRYALKDVVRD